MAPYCGLASPQLLNRVLGVGYPKPPVRGQQTKRVFLLRIMLELSGRNTSFTQVCLILNEAFFGRMGFTSEVHSPGSQKGSHIPLPCPPLGSIMSAP